MSLRQDPDACEICFNKPPPGSLRHCPRCTAHICMPCFNAWLNVRIQSATPNHLTCLSCPEPIADSELRAVCGERAYRRCLYLRSRFAHRQDPRAAWCPADGCWALLPRPAAAPPDANAKSPVPSRSPPSSAPSHRVRDRRRARHRGRHDPSPSPAPPPPALPPLVCPDCSTEVCASCHMPAHAGTPCATPTATLAHRTASALWHRLHTKKCPSCAVRIQRSGGCNQMHCASCHTKFCWRCRGLLHLPHDLFGFEPPVPSSVVTVVRSGRVSRGAAALTGGGGGSGAEVDAGGGGGGGGGAAAGRPLYGCVCPRVHSTLSHIGVAGGVIVAAPLALAVAVVVAPPALIVYAFLPEERKRRVRNDIASLSRRI